MTERWRVLVHALDRTGPPMLARSMIRWITAHCSDDEVEVVAFRGGAMEEEFRSLCPVHVVLDASEPWNHSSPDPDRVATLRARLDVLDDPSATLLVSVAAGQVLSLLRESTGPVVTWVVERGEDLHWLGGPVDVVGRTSVWLAGSRGSEDEMRRILGADADIRRAPEFIEPADPTPATVERHRAELGLQPGQLLVLGAGIGTYRKGADLFVEVALAFGRRFGSFGLFVWIGGEDDPLVPLLKRELARHGLEAAVFVPSVDDLDSWLAAGDVFVHPARLDAFPLVCLHAAAVGTPVLAFRECGGTEEMFGVAFVGVDYPDVEAMAVQVHDCLDVGRRRRVGTAQRRRVLELFTSDRAAPAVMEQLASGHSGHQAHRS